MPSRATHVEARLAELPVGHPRQRENFHRTQVLKPTEMAFPHSPPTRHCTQVHPLSLQPAVALLPPSLPLSPRGNGRAAFSRSAPRRGGPPSCAPPACGPPSCACPSCVALSCSASLAEVGSHPSFPWPRSHTTPSCAAPSSGSRGGISSSVLSPSSSRPVSITSCAPTLGAWGACLAEALPICRGNNGGE